jgi:hypothetical protein
MAPNVGLDVGAGLAWSYFYGFLNLILKGMKSRISESEFNDDTKHSGKMFSKVLVLLPESCFCPSTLTEDDPDHFKHIGFIPFRANRAGNVARDYKSSVYEVTNPDKPTEKYLVIIELATPLMSLYEMHIDGLADLSEERKQTERTKFIDTLKFILQHPKAEELGKAITFLSYKDPRTADNKPQFKLAKLICDHVREHL